MRQNRLTELEKKQDSLIKEMDELFSAYMMEMKDENEKFLKELQSINLERESLKSSSSFKEKKVNVKMNQPNKQDILIKDESPYPKGTVFQAVKAYTKSTNINSNSNQDSSINKGEVLEKAPNSEENERDHAQEELKYNTMDSLLKQAQVMQKQGHSIEDIAKKLDKGKTEIELLLKFHQNDQE